MDKIRMIGKYGASNQLFKEASDLPAFAFDVILIIYAGQGGRIWKWRYDDVR